MVGALALGMGQVLRYPLLAAAVAILGGAFLVWMGGKMGWEVVRRRPSLPRTDEGSGVQVNRGLIGLGIVTTVSNPFWYVWWVGAGGGVRGIDPAGWVGGPGCLLSGPHRRRLCLEHLSGLGRGLGPPLAERPCLPGDSPGVRSVPRHHRCALRVGGGCGGGVTQPTMVLLPRHA